jgi:GDP-L-fucose synthase
MAINPNEHSILEIANIICNTLEIPKNDIIFDSNKPMGQYRKPAISNAPEDFSFITLEEGIKKTIDWFIGNYNTIRK